jgi:hypothetical protein
MRSRGGLIKVVCRKTEIYVNPPLQKLYQACLWEDRNLCEPTPRDFFSVELDTTAEHLGHFVGTR